MRRHRLHDCLPEIVDLKGHIPLKSTSLVVINTMHDMEPTTIQITTITIGSMNGTGQQIVLINGQIGSDGERDGQRSFTYPHVETKK